jgi:hypothetical protein
MSLIFWKLACKCSRYGNRPVLTDGFEYAVREGRALKRPRPQSRPRARLPTRRANVKNLRFLLDFEWSALADDFRTFDLMAF